MKISCSSFRNICLWLVRESRFKNFEFLFKILLFVEEYNDVVFNFNIEIGFCSFSLELNVYKFYYESNYFYMNFGIILIFLGF